MVLRRCTRFGSKCTKNCIGQVVPSYAPWDPLDPEDRRTQLLSSSVLGDYDRWWVYTLDHMNRVVDALYPADTDLANDSAAVTWAREAAALAHGCDALVPVTRERVAAVLASVFFVQVRHNFLSSPWLLHIRRWCYILRQDGPTSISQAMRIVLIGVATQMQWVPLMGRGFEKVVEHAGARAALTDFYAGLESTGDFARSIQHPLALPSEMEVSAGV